MKKRQLHALIGNLFRLSTFDSEQTRKQFGGFFKVLVVLLLAPFLLGLGRLIVLARARRRAHPNEQPDAAAASVAACMIGTLLMLALSSFGTILAFLYWVLAAVAVGLSTKSAEVRASPGAVSQTAGWQRRNAARGVRASV